MKILKVETYTLNQYKLKQVKGLYKDKIFDIGKFYTDDDLVASFIKVYRAGKLVLVKMKSRSKKYWRG